MLNESCEEFLSSLIEKQCDLTVLDLDWDGNRLEVIVATDEDTGCGLTVADLIALGQLVASKEVLINVAGPEALVVTVLNADIAPFLDMAWATEAQTESEKDN